MIELHDESPRFACLSIETTCCRFTGYTWVHKWCGLAAEKKLHFNFSENKAQIFALVWEVVSICKLLEEERTFQEQKVQEQVNQ
jgi:hypothetical protein